MSFYWQQTKRHLPGLNNPSSKKKKPTGKKEETNESKMKKILSLSYNSSNNVLLPYTPSTITLCTKHMV